MKKRLLALLVTALVLCTMAVTSFAELVSNGWITFTPERTNIQETGTIDTSNGVRVTVVYYTTSANDGRITLNATVEQTGAPDGQIGSWCYITPSSDFQTVDLLLGDFPNVSNKLIGINVDGLTDGNFVFRYTITELDEPTESGTYQEGYNAGYTAGDTAGYDRGYTAGDTAGYDRGYTAGDTAGYDRGYTAGDTAGYERGYNDGIAIGGNNGTYQEGYNAGYTAGDSAGYNRGYTEGYTLGYEDGVDDVDPEGLYQRGFADGKAQGQDDAQIVDIAINGFFDSLTGFIEPFTNIGIGGLTIGAMLTLMVTVGIVMIIIKVVRG